ncbi:MAG: hypothetical protein WC626_12830 [Methanoregula sp.]
MHSFRALFPRICRAEQRGSLHCGRADRNARSVCCPHTSQSCSSYESKPWQTFVGKPVKELNGTFGVY